MSAPFIIPADCYVDGTLSAKSLIPSPGAINDAQVGGFAGIQATKLQHQHAINYTQDPGTAVVAATRTLWVVRGATAKLVELACMVTDVIATGGDRTVTIDLKRSTGAGAFASVLAATVVLNSSSTLLTRSYGSFSVTDLVAGDVMELTVAVAGAAGNQAKGLHVTLTAREDAS